MPGATLLLPVTLQQQEEGESSTVMLPVDRHMLLVRGHVQVEDDGNGGSGDEAGEDVQGKGEEQPSQLGAGDGYLLPSKKKKQKAKKAKEEGASEELEGAKPKKKRKSRGG